MSTIPALTIWEPWASLIIAGAKPYEFRGWPAPGKLVGARIAIHAGARPVCPAEVRALLIQLKGPNAWATSLRPEIAIPLLEHVASGAVILPRSHVLGTAVLGRPLRGHEVVGEFGGVVNDSDRDQHFNWAWPLTDIRPLLPPVPAKGAQGFWRWNEETAA